MLCRVAGPLHAAPLQSSLVSIDSYRTRRLRAQLCTIGSRPRVAALVNTELFHLALSQPATYSNATVTAEMPLMADNPFSMLATHAPHVMPALRQ